MDWNQSLALIVMKIIAKLQGEELYLFFDEGTNATDDELLTFYELAQLGLAKGYNIIFASSSGISFKRNKYVRTAAGNLIGTLKRMDVLQFTINEAYQFLNMHNVDQEWHAKIVFVAGTVPWMLGHFKYTTSAFSFSCNKNLAMRPIQDMISELELSKHDISGRYTRSICNCIVLLSKASINSTISSGELDNYVTSYLANEHLISWSKRKNRKILFCNFQKPRLVERVKTWVDGVELCRR